MPPAFVPATPLEQAVQAGDYESVVALLRGMSPEQRSGVRASAVRIAKSLRSRERVEPPEFAGWAEPRALKSGEQRRAAAAVALVCGTAKDAAELYHHVNDVIALGTEFRSAALADFGSELIKRDPWRIHEVQKLIGAGVVERPDCDEYTLGLLWLFRHRDHAGEGIDAPFNADPGLKDVLLRIMDFEGTGGAHLASADKYNREEWRWSTILMKLIERGMYSRSHMLDKTLSSLERDWPPSRSGWFSAFHETLAPTIDEMTPHLQRYLALLGSRIPPTVKFALSVATKLDAARSIPDDRLLVALRPVASSEVKGHVTALLKLLDRVVKRHPELAISAAALIVPALAHSSADVQRDVLRRLDTWGMDAATRESARKYAAGIWAVHREELARLTGAEPPRPAVAAAAAAKRTVGRVRALDPGRRIAPIESLDELVERTAFVFEHSNDIDEVERVLGALVRAAPLSAEARQRFAPVATRLAKLRTPLAAEVGRLLHFLLAGRRIVAAPTRGAFGPVLADQHLIRHVDALLDLAAQGKGFAPLTTPTHRRGYIDPAELVERVRAYVSSGVQTTVEEQAGALLRLAPELDTSVLAAARKLPRSPLTLALRYALGDDLERPVDSVLHAAAERIRAALSGSSTRSCEWFFRNPATEVNANRLSFRVVERSQEPSPDPVTVLERHAAQRDKGGWFSRPSVAEDNEGFVVYYSTLVPSDLESFFADGASAIATNIDWSQTQWSSSAYLRCLLDANVPMKAIATLLLAVGLAAKEPGHAALAVDALVQSHAESRLDASLLAATIRDLLRAGIVANGRYAKSLRAALRIDTTVSDAVREIVLAALQANPTEPFKDTSALLELLAEIVIPGNQKLDAAARATLERMTLGGKSAALRKTLLDCD